MAFDNGLKQDNLWVKPQLEAKSQFAISPLEQLPSNVFWINSKTRFPYVKQVDCGLTGYSSEELLSMTMHKIDPDFSAKVGSEYWRTINQQRFRYCESQYQTKEGGKFPVEVTVISLKYHSRDYSCIFDHQISNYKHLAGAFQRTKEALEAKVTQRITELRTSNEQLGREIAERKQVEDEFAEEAERFRSTFNSAAIGIAHIRTDGKWLLVNQKLCDIVNYTQEELQSHTFQDITHTDDLAVNLEYVRQILANEIQTYSMEKRYICKGGALVWVNLTVSLVREPKGKPKYFIAFVEDISERKQAEEEIKEALKQEKELSSLKASFVSMVSHEFRTPLNIISFSTSLVRRHSQQWAEQKKIEYCHRIQTAVEQLTQLIDGVLITSKAEAGKLSFDPKPLDLDQFCYDLVTEIQLSNSSHHTLAFVNQGDCSTACLDQKLLRPILTNLLLNAIKYSSVNSTVDFIVFCKDKEVIFQIKDWGIGISAADQKQLFEPFYRGGNVNNIPGTGLGLALVKKLVDNHGGEIFLASEVGVGSTFTVVLPSEGN